MRRTGFFVSALALALALSLVVGVGSYLWQVQAHPLTTVGLPPFLMASGWIFVGLAAAILWIGGIASLLRGDLEGTERAVWLLILLLFPVLGTLIWLVSRPGQRHRPANAMHVELERRRRMRFARVARPPGPGE